MKALKYMSCAWILLALTACEAVYSPQPIGEKPVAVEAEDWEGTWISAEGAFTVEVVDGKEGVLKVAWIDTSNVELESISIEGSLRASGEWMFGSVKDMDDPDRDVYVWGKVKKDDGQVTIWVPDVGKFKELVLKGVLPGGIEEDNVVLGDLQPEHMEIITSSSEGVLFDWKDPITFIRVGK